MTVYLLPEAKAAAQQRRDRDGVTNAEVAFDAIDNAFAELQQLVQHRRTLPRAEDSLFPSRRAPRRNLNVEARRVIWSIQATAAELEVLDSLVAEIGAESRSELISVAVEAQLLSKPRRR